MGHRTILCSYCNKPLQVTQEEKTNKITCPVCNRKTMVPRFSSSIKELDFYALKKPYSYVSILKDKESLKKQYIVLEPTLTSDNKEILLFLKEKIIHTLNVRLDELGDEAESYLKTAVEEMLQKYEIILDGVSWAKIFYYLKKQFLGYNDINPLMNDPFIEDISCDGAKVPLFVVQRRFGSLETNIVFPNDESLAKFVIKLAQKCGKHISVSDPMLDATMPDGSRIQMTLSGEVTTRGSTFTIRKFRADPITAVDLVDYQTFSMKMIAYLWMAVEHEFNALISGGTASGKTSALNALALFVPRESKIVSIEETREINLPHPNWIPGVTRSGFGEIVNNRVTGEIDLFDLMKAALRQRPEYILVGEIRGKEAYVLFQAMATGHTTYSTVHADSIQALIHRLEGKPINIPRTMLQSLDLVLIMRNQKTQEKNQRRCIRIVELLNVDNETNEVLTNTVFEWDPIEGIFSYSGKSYILEQIRSQNDMSADEMTKELGQRADILNWMRKYHIRKFTSVTNLLAKYLETPEKVLEIIKKEPEKIDEEIKDTLSITEDESESILEEKSVILRNKKNQQLIQAKQEKKSLFKSIFSSDQYIEKKTLSKSDKNNKDSFSFSKKKKEKIQKKPALYYSRKKIKNELVSIETNSLDDIENHIDEQLQSIDKRDTTTEDYNQVAQEIDQNKSSITENKSKKIGKKTQKNSIQKKNTQRKKRESVTLKRPKIRIRFNKKKLKTKLKKK